MGNDERYFGLATDAAEAIVHALTYEDFEDDIKISLKGLQMVLAEFAGAAIDTAGTEEVDPLIFAAYASGVAYVLAPLVNAAVLIEGQKEIDAL